MGRRWAFCHFILTADIVDLCYLIDVTFDIDKLTNSRFNTIIYIRSSIFKDIDGSSRKAKERIIVHLSFETEVGNGLPKERVE